jgi:hypothetical protein
LFGELLQTTLEVERNKLTVELVCNDDLQGGMAVDRMVRNSVVMAIFPAIGSFQS